MFLKSLLNPKHSARWTLFHIGLALACTTTPFALIGWFYLILLTSISTAITQLQRGQIVFFLSLLFYLVSFEMLGRMARAYPYVPTEIGKYFIIIFSCIGILIKGIRSNKAIVMVLLLIPSLFYDLSGQRVFTDIVFNIFGPLGLALGLAFLYKVRVSQFELDQMLHLIWLTCLSALFFTFIKTPDLESIDFSLKSEFATTADTSSNQVSTILGLGLFLSFYSIINRLKFSGYFLTDLALLLLFSFQGLLSFSRGGMLIAAIAILILLIYSSRAPSKSNRSKLIVASFFAIIGIYIIFQIANQVTGGTLLLRYSGETKGTLLGTKEKTADVIVSGRLTIFNEDIEIWKKHPIGGVGAGTSRYIREETYRVVPHVELSRLLAEHGILGIIYLLLLLLIFWSSYKSLPHQSYRGVFLSLFLIGFLTTFHAAMRTFVPPVMLLLAILYVKSEKSKEPIIGKRYSNRITYTLSTKTT